MSDRRVTGRKETALAEQNPPRVHVGWNEDPDIPRFGADDPDTDDDRDAE